MAALGLRSEVPFLHLPQLSSPESILLGRAGPHILRHCGWQLAQLFLETDGQCVIKSLKNTPSVSPREGSKVRAQMLTGLNVHVSIIYDQGNPETT